MIGCRWQDAVLGLCCCVVLLSLRVSNLSNDPRLLLMNIYISNIY